MLCSSLPLIALFTALSLSLYCREQDPSFLELVPGDVVSLRENADKPEECVASESGYDTQKHHTVAAQDDNDGAEADDYAH